MFCWQYIYWRKFDFLLELFVGLLVKTRFNCIMQCTNFSRIFWTFHRNDKSLEKHYTHLIPMNFVSWLKFVCEITHDCIVYCLIINLKFYVRVNHVDQLISINRAKRFVRKVLLPRKIRWPTRKLIMWLFFLFSIDLIKRSITVNLKQTWLENWSRIKRIY